MNNIFQKMMRFFLLAMFLVAAGQQTAYAQLYSGPQEFSMMEVPQRIVFKREPVSWWWPPTYGNNRYVQYAGLPLTKMTPGPFVTGPGGSALETAKNPEGLLRHGPAHAQNVTVGYFSGATQWLRFRVKTKNFFRADTSRHLAFLMRANFPGQNYNPEGYDGMGVIFTQYPSLGITGEIFNTIHPDPRPFNPPTGLVSVDDATFFVQMYAGSRGVNYNITNELTGQNSGWISQVLSPGTPDLTRGLAFAVICDDSNGRCEDKSVFLDPGPKSEFTVDIWDIASGWL